ncbi:hypothetical protein CERZMDRAFT_80747 [Cercospora zeae-maydis SCOH1-5]|uniref:SprT-like domain-containing protein n=1 Tax=Cercospora zeae-maydis SCOH1-5 TaxID=717836 RepID=A0A6A6FT74_9PEZI|nr:hypothetical protein CERZMDRAFT_80747 [Cercospora zeae-maydis SCOH1-5]
MLDFSCLARHDDAGAIKDRRRAYSAMKLAKVCIDFIEIPYDNWDAHRKQAWEDLRDWYTAWEEKCDVSGVAVPGGDDMSALTHLIGEVFFGGQLTDTSFRWKTLAKLVNGKPQGYLIYGRTSIPDEDDISEENKPRIEMDARNRSQRYDYDHRATIFDTLLHECIHAYLGSYACGSDTCNCRNETSRDFGATGHGPAFIQIGTHIVDFFESHVTDWQHTKPTLDLDYSLQCEYTASGHVLRNKDIAGCAQGLRPRMQKFRKRSWMVNERLAQFDAMFRREVGVKEIKRAKKAARDAAMEDAERWDRNPREKELKLPVEQPTGRRLKSGCELVHAMGMMFVTGGTFHSPLLLVRHACTAHVLGTHASHKHSEHISLTNNESSYFTISTAQTKSNNASCGLNYHNSFAKVYPNTQRALTSNQSTSRQSPDSMTTPRPLPALTLDQSLFQNKPRPVPQIAPRSSSQSPSETSEDQVDLRRREARDRRIASMLARAERGMYAMCGGLDDTPSDRMHS